MGWAMQAWLVIGNPNPMIQGIAKFGVVNPDSVLQNRGIMAQARTFAHNSPIRLTTDEALHILCFIHGLEMFESQFELARCNF